MGSSHLGIVSSFKLAGDAFPTNDVLSDANATFAAAPTRNNSQSGVGFGFGSVQTP
jgi:hypothetical protein